MQRPVLRAQAADPSADDAVGLDGLREVEGADRKQVEYDALQRGLARLRLDALAEVPEDRRDGAGPRREPLVAT